MASSGPRLLLLSYLAFIALGLPDTVLGVAWPSLRAAFDVPQSALGAALMAGVTGYFLSGLAVGSLSSRLGTGGLLSLSSALVAAALVAFAVAPSWFWFFPVAAVMGLGSGAIDAGLNSYAAKHFSIRHVNWLHACWGIGASIGPLVMTTAVASRFGYSAGYAVLAALLGSMAGAFLLTRHSWNEGREHELSSVPPPSIPTVTFASALQDRKVWCSALAFFCYTGVESTLGQWCFTLLRERRGLSLESAGTWTAAYWASLTIGRFALGWVVDRMGADRMLRAATLGVLLGSAAFASGSGILGQAGLLVVGISLAPIFPTLIARTPARLGVATSNHAVGMQMSAATLGSALLPGMVGVLVARTSLAAIEVSAVALSVALLLAHELVLYITRPTQRSSPPSRSRPAT